jgi:predicted GTPase
LSFRQGKEMFIEAERCGRVERVVIMGAAGRDFHNFNVYFRGNPRYHVVAFTTAQIPIAGRRFYPPALAGPEYPEGIPIFPEEELGVLIRDHSVDLVVFSYSDVSYEELMHKASIATTEGADFALLGTTYTMVKSRKPVVSICAVRTGAGKSATTRKVCSIITDRLKKKVVVVRHPMPYGDLEEQVVQRFASYEDLSNQGCTIEEREEYEPLIGQRLVVYAGVDYGLVLERAEQEADIIVWDGGNNDTPFYRPDLHIVLFDPFRAGHELSYYPGENNMRMAQIAVINKVDSAAPEAVESIRKTIRTYAPRAEIIYAASAISAPNHERITGKRVVVVEDGPTMTHGGMSYGAGTIAARRFGAAEIIDPRPFACGSIKETYHLYPHLGAVLPAVGYSPQQVADLAETINRIDCDIIILGTPTHLARILAVNKPMLPISYAYEDHGSPSLEELLLKQLGPLFSDDAPSAGTDQQ